MALMTLVLSYHWMVSGVDGDAPRPRRCQGVARQQRARARRRHLPENWARTGAVVSR